MGRAYGGEKIEICGNPAISGVRSRCIPNAGDDDWEQGSIKVKNIYRTGEFSHNYVRQPKAYRFCRYIISRGRKKVDLVSRKFEKKLSRLLVFSGENIVNLWECIMFAYGYKSWKYLMRASFALMFYPTLLKVWPISYLLKLKDVGNEIFLWTAFKLIR